MADKISDKGFTSGGGMTGGSSAQQYDDTSPDQNRWSPEKRKAQGLGDYAQGDQKNYNSGGGTSGSST